MKYLVLRLSAPLMSFGEGDYWDIRGTSIFPTKSAIVGILASCFGYDRNETEKISFLIENISVDGNDKYSMVKNIPPVEVEGRKMISIITEDLIKLLSK